MDDLTDDLSPRDAIARLEARIEALSSAVESCHKFMLAARLAIAAGGVLLALTLIRVIAFDPTVLFGSIAVVLGGVVVLGSNTTTARQALEARAKAEAERAALIGAIELRVVEGRETLH